MMIYVLKNIQLSANMALLMNAGQKPKFACNGSNEFVSYKDGCHAIDRGECSNFTLQSDFYG